MTRVADLLRSFAYRLGNRDYRGTQSACNPRSVGIWIPDHGCLEPCFTRLGGTRWSLNHQENRSKFLFQPPLWRSPGTRSQGGMLSQPMVNTGIAMALCPEPWHHPASSIDPFVSHDGSTPCLRVFPGVSWNNRRLHITRVGYVRCRGQSRSHRADMPRAQAWPQPVPVGDQPCVCQFSMRQQFLLRISGPHYIT